MVRPSRQLSGSSWLLLGLTWPSMRETSTPSLGMCLIEFSGTWPNPFFCKQKEQCWWDVKMQMRWRPWRRLGGNSRHRRGRDLWNSSKHILVLLSYWYCCHIGTAAILVSLSYWYCRCIGIVVVLVLLLFYSSKFQPKSINAKMNP